MLMAFRIVILFGLGVLSGQLLAQAIYPRLSSWVEHKVEHLERWVDNNGPK